MKIVYTPRDNPEAVEEYPVDITLLWVGEVKLLEKVMGETIADFGGALMNGSFTHMSALIWILRRRADRELRLDDMDESVMMSELEPVFNEEEQAEIDAAEKAEREASDPKGEAADAPAKRAKPKA